MSASQQYAPKDAAQPKSNPPLEAALSYAAKGLAVFRLVYKTKSPLKGSHGCYDGTVNTATIINLFSLDLYNVAISTGDISGIAVLDIDPHKGGFGSFDAMLDEHGEPFDAEGPKIITGNDGWQFPFQMPAALIRSGTNVFGLPGIDVKANGGYVVAPPSIHPNGNAYIFEEGRSYDDLPIPKLSERWLQLLLKENFGGLGTITLEEYSHSVIRVSTPIDPNFDPRQVDLAAIRRELEELVRTRALGDKAVFDALVKRADLQYLAAVGRGIPARDVVRAIRMGDSGRIFCVKPGHDEKRSSKSAGLRVHPKHKTLQYQDYHGDHSAREVNHRVPDLEANMHRRGREIMLSDAMLKAWQVRLWVLDGLVEPAEVPHVALPERLPGNHPLKLKPVTLFELGQVYDVALDLLSVKWLYCDGPQAMTHKTLATWGRLTEHLVEKVFPWLLYLGALEGGVFLQPWGGLSTKRGDKKNPECFKPGDGEAHWRRGYELDLEENEDE
jgi:hypothetical protein